MEKDKLSVNIEFMFLFSLREIILLFPYRRRDDVSYKLR